MFELIINSIDVLLSWHFSHKQPKIDAIVVDMQELPGPVTDEPVTQIPDTADSTGPDSLKIAWRYQNLSKVQVSQIRL